MGRTHHALLCLSLSACGGTTVVAPSDGATAVDAATDARTDTPAPADAGCGTAAPTDPLVARTELGLLRGAMSEESLAWLGVPFTEPPTGALRWRPPVEPTRCWGAVREATTWAPRCPQIPQQQGQPFDPNAPVVGQEDCLTLNVWRPANAPADAALPVMVFIHGGGNSVGYAGEVTPNGVRLYDGSRLAARGNVVVVTVEYRIGALGYMLHPGLEAEPDGAPGNLGLLDQIAALRWVQRNIRGFRGDPARVMVFGESAGAVNVCALVASPRAAGLFSRALMQSGSCFATIPTDVARAQAETFAQRTNCAAAPDVPACLRALSAEAVVRALAGPVNVSGLETGGARWGPIVDGRVLTMRAYDLIAAGQHNRVPAVVGHNTEEVGATVPAIANEAAYRAALTTAFGAVLAEQILQRYPVSRYNTPRGALVQALTDARFGCQARMTARALARGQPGVASHRYLFAQPFESGGTARLLGAFHGLELLWVFQNGARGMNPPTENELAVERALLGYWTRFAATGDPNGGADPPWARYATGEPLLRIAATSQEVRGWRTEECDYIDSVVQVMTPVP